MVSALADMPPKNSAEDTSKKPWINCMYLLLPRAGWAFNAEKPSWCAYSHIFMWFVNRDFAQARPAVLYSRAGRGTVGKS